MPLPGAHSISASAGTGKTYAITTLYLRYLLEAGCSVEEILVTTFTRSATAELKDRIRARLELAQRSLDTPVDDPQLMSITGSPDDATRIQMRGRLGLALRDFDQAAIYTMDGFCQRTLREFVFEIGSAFTQELIPSQEDLIEQAVMDYIATHWMADDSALAVSCPLTGTLRKKLIQAATVAVNEPDLDLVPAEAVDPEDVTPAVLCDVAGYAREHVAACKRRAGVASFADQLQQVAHALQDPKGGDALAAVLRSRYRVALVDEFQDTSPTQYQVFRTLFFDGLSDAAHPVLAMVMIGDPKQSIYQFRGADIDSYLAACRDTGPQRQYTMTTNWRSDASLVEGVNKIMGGEGRVTDPFCSPEIPFVEVDAHHAGTADRDSGVSVRWIPGGVATAKKGPSTKDAWPRTLGVLTDDIALRVNSPGVQAGDLAVLCSMNSHLMEIQSSLANRGIPAVLTCDASVYDTLEARHLVTLLHGIRRPSDRQALATAMLTPLLNSDYADLQAMQQDDSLRALWTRRCERYRDLAAADGFMAMWTTLLSEQNTLLRLASGAMAERRITNYQHVAECLHQHARTATAGLAEWIEWLEKQIDGGGQRGDEQSQLRLESDAQAVQLSTIHKAKGLEFPVVYCPTLWQGKDPAKARKAACYAIDRQGDATLDFGSAQYAERLDANLAARQAEDRRLLYVALTRAKHECVIYWTGAEASKHTAMEALICQASGEAGPLGLLGDDALRDTLERWIDGLGTAAISLDTDLASADPDAAAGQVEPIAWQAPPAILRHPLPVARQSSFSAMARTIVLPEDVVAPDRDAISAAAAMGTDGAASVDERIADPDLPGGVLLGNLIHQLLEDVLAQPERTDDAISDLLDRRLDECMSRYQFQPAWTVSLKQMLRSTLDCPLPIGSTPVSLQALSPSELICEMPFLMRAGHPGHPVDAGPLTDAFATSANPMAARYAERIAHVSTHSLAGFLSGFVDLTFRCDGRWYIVDYKTNWLGDRCVDYHQGPVEQAMCSHDYVLQYHLYTVALHRMLQRKVPGYTYETHFGGVLYLFCRGLSVGGGVFSDMPDAATIASLSDLLTEGGMG